MTVLTIGNEGDHDMLACEDGARVLSIAMDLARQCRDDYDERLSHLIYLGAVADLSEQSAKRRKGAQSQATG